MIIEKELKLQFADAAIKTICPEKTMEELYTLQGLTPSKHINVITHHEYTGLNRYALELSMLLNNFDSSEWATFNQFTSAHKQILKGSKCTKICVAIYNKKKDKESKEEQEVLNFFKGGSVFNINQTKDKERGE